MSIVPGVVACGSRREARVTTDCDPYWDNVVLAMHMDGSDESATFIDEKGHSVTSNYGVISTTQHKFGGSSLRLANSYPSQIMTTSNDYIIGTDDFTVDAFIYMASYNGDKRLLNPAAGGYIVAEIKNGTGLLAATGVGGVGDAVPLYTWFHVAFSRSGGVLKAFINGVQQWSAEYLINISASSIWPAYQAGINDFYIDDLRITKGVARYTEDFTPPTSPFSEDCYIPIPDVPAFVIIDKEVVTETPPEFVPDPTPVALTGAGGRMLVNIGSYSYQVRRDASFYDNLVKFNSSTYEVVNVSQSFGACDPVYAESGRFLGCANTDHSIHSICTDGTYLYLSAHKDLRKYDSSLNIVENVTSSVTYDQLCYANSYLWATDYVHIYKINPTTLLVETTINFPIIVGVTNYLCRMETDGTHVYININSNASLHKLNCVTNEITTYSVTDILHTVINGYAYLTTEKVNLSNGAVSTHSLVLNYSLDSNRNYISNFGTIFTHYTGISTQGIYGKGIIRIIDSIDDSIVSTITNFEELSSVQCGNFCIYDYKKPTGIGLLSEDKLIISNGSASYYQFQEGYSIYELI